MDHQGINFKANDKKNISSKGLVAEIEATYRERFEKAKKSDITPNAPHLSFTFTNRELMADVKKLVESYLEKSAQYSAEDQERVQKFLDKFMDVFFPSKAANGEQAKLPSRVISTFGNTTFYLFFRLFWVNRI